MPQLGENFMNSVESGIHNVLSLKPVAGTLRFASDLRQSIGNRLDQVPGIEYADKAASAVSDLANKAYEASPMGIAEKGAEKLSEQTSEALNIDPRFLGLLVGMVRSTRDIRGLKKLTATDKSTGNYGSSVEEAYKRGQSQYINKKGVLMDAGWSKAGYGNDLVETHPFDPARRQANNANRRAQEKAALFTQNDFTEVYGSATGKELYKEYRSQLKQKFADNPVGSDVDHFLPLSVTKQHHPHLLWSLDSSINRGDGARKNWFKDPEMLEFLRTSMKIGTTKSGTIALQGPNLNQKHFQQLYNRWRSQRGQ
tara:strand:+ start:231 stop:1163 length:933 start_codon:yes stop_codon:yes gene_type:complete